MSQAIPIEQIDGLSSSFQSWTVRSYLSPHSTIDPAETLETAREMIADFRKLREAAEEFGVDLVVREVPEGEEPNDVTSVAGADDLLALVRNTRRSLKTSKARFLPELVRVDTAMAVEFNRELQQTLPLFDEFEQLLIVFGAGDDEDADLIMDMLPTAEDLGLSA